eukprot:gene123-1035_t
MPAGTQNTPGVVLMKTPERKSVSRDIASDFLSPGQKQQTSPGASNSREPIPVRHEDTYVNDLIRDFGVGSLDEIVWSHGCNNRTLLAKALTNPAVQFIEVDVSIGTYKRGRTFSLCDNSSRRDYVQPQPNRVIACHYPTHRSSDLLISQCIEEIRSYNHDIILDRKKETPETAASLDDASGSISPMCPAKVSGTPRSQLMPYDDSALENKKIPKNIKGLKLDFKHWHAVEPTLQLLAQGDTMKDFPHIWLNADVLVGPGTNGFQGPIPAIPFLQVCTIVLALNLFNKMKAKV